MTQPANISKGADIATGIMGLVNARIRALTPDGEAPPDPVKIGDFPIIDAIFHARGPEGKPAVIQTGQPWPGDPTRMAVAFIFRAEGGEYHVYALPTRMPVKDEILGPRRYVLRLDVWSGAAELLPTTWSDEVASEILNVIGIDEDDDGGDEDGDDGDDEDGATAASAVGSQPAANGSTAGAAS